ncbi:MAG: VF530 family DNA-binding protein [Cellvibrionaceae bacterium]
MIEEQKNNPLHGVKLEALLTDLVDHYGWEVLASEININCFKSNPSIKSSLKFLRRTEWAREKVEGFYLYKFKRLPKPDDVQYELPPRDRIVPLDQKPRSPAVIKPRERGEAPEKKKPSSADRDRNDNPYDSPKPRKQPRQPDSDQSTGGDAWANWRNKNK